MGVILSKVLCRMLRNKDKIDVYFVFCFNRGENICLRVVIKSVKCDEW